MAKEHIFRHWRGTRDSYMKIMATADPWTQYTVIDTIDGKEVITEYYGNKKIEEHTGQVLPVDAIVDISEASEERYSVPGHRYLVKKGEGTYEIWTHYPDRYGTRVEISEFDSRFGVRVINEKLKNYVLVDGKLVTYDDIDCGTF